MASHRIEEVNSEYNGSFVSYVSTHDRKNTGRGNNDGSIIGDGKQIRKSGLNNTLTKGPLLEVDEEEESENSKKL